MATKDSIMKQSIFFWVIEHRLSFEYGLKKFHHVDVLLDATSSIR